MKDITSSDNEREEFIGFLSDQTFLAMILLQDNQVKYTNQATATVFGTTIEEIYKWDAQSILAAVDEENRAFAAEQLMKKQKGESDVVTSYSVKINTPTGTKYINLFSKTVLYK